MTELATEALRTRRTGRARSPMSSSSRTTWRTASCGSRSPVSATASTPSTTSAPAPKQRCPLSGGLLTGTTLMCQCHGSRFDLTTGAVLNGPATEPLHRLRGPGGRRRDPEFGCDGHRHCAKGGTRWTARAGPTPPRRRRSSRSRRCSSRVLRDRVRGLHHRHLPQAPSARHQARQSSGRRHRRRLYAPDWRRWAARRSTSRRWRASPEAAHAVRERDLNAAFVPSATPRQPAIVIVASAAGRIVATGTESFLRAATAAQGTQLAVRDVRPLPSGDVIGLGVFLFMIVCTICGYITADDPRDRRPRRCRRAAATR